MPRFRTIPLLAFATLSVLGPLRADAAAGLRFLRESPLSRFTEQDFDLLRSAALVVLDSESSDASQDWANEATGNSGKIFRLAGDPFQPTLIARANAQQVTGLLQQSEGRVLIATSNPGKLLRLAAARADRGTYTSAVRDAQTVALWGTLKWQSLTPAGSRLEKRRSKEITVREANESP